MFAIMPGLTTDRRFAHVAVPGLTTIADVRPHNSLRRHTLPSLTYPFLQHLICIPTMAKERQIWMSRF